MLQLYTYFRSSASFRVRIALAIKGLEYQSIPIHLLRNGGEQLQPAYTDRNPAGLIPMLVDDGISVPQSIAIMEYLEETYPTPALLPSTPRERAWVRALMLSIACDIHPLNNLRVLKYLKSPLDVDEERRNEWSRHWIELGFSSIERTLQERAAFGDYCFGARPTLADCCLVPQVFNARRVNCRLESFPRILQIYEHCMRDAAFQRAAPGAQNDAE